MSDYPTLDRLRARNETIPDPPSLPSTEEVNRLTDLLGCQLPPSYLAYLSKYADITFGRFEPYWAFQDGSRLDLIKNVTEAWRYFGLPAHLVPFVEDRSRYYCFDTTGLAPEYPVVCWHLDTGEIEETWTDFQDWVRHCWLGEGD